MMKGIVEKYQEGFQKMLEDKEAVYELLKVLDGKYPRVSRELTWAYNYIQDAYALAYKDLFNPKFRWKRKTRKRKSGKYKYIETYSRRSQGIPKGN